MGRVDATDPPSRQLTHEQELYVFLRSMQIHRQRWNHDDKCNVRVTRDHNSSGAPYPTSSRRNDQDARWFSGFIKRVKIRSDVSRSQATMTEETRRGGSREQRTKDPKVGFGKFPGKWRGCRAGERPYIVLSPTKCMKRLQTEKDLHVSRYAPRRQLNGSKCTRHTVEPSSRARRVLRFIPFHETLYLHGNGIGKHRDTMQSYQ